MSVPPVAFRYDVRLKGRTVVQIHGMRSPSGGCDVATETWPVGQSPDAPALHRTFAFGTVELARRFTDELLTTLEYQSCEVNTVV